MAPPAPAPQVILRPLINSDIDGLDRLRTRWETARRTIGGHRTLPYTLHLLDGPRYAESTIFLAVKELPRGQSAGFLVGVENRPGLPLCPMTLTETQLLWDRIEETLKNTKCNVHVDRTAYALHPDVVGDRVYVERPRDVEEHLWDDEPLDDEDFEEEEFETGEEEGDEGGGGWDDAEEEQVEPVFVLHVVVTRLFPNT